MGLVQDFGEGVGKVLLPPIQATLDRVEAAAKAELAKIPALLPLVAAAVAKAAVEQVIEHIPGINLLPGGLDVQSIAETVRTDLNKIPDIDIPVLSDIFDLTDFLKNLGK